MTAPTQPAAPTAGVQPTAAQEAGFSEQQEALNHIDVKVKAHGKKAFIAKATSEYLPKANLVVKMNGDKLSIISNSKLSKVAPTAASRQPIVDKCLQEIARFQEEHAGKKVKSKDAKKGIKVKHEVHYKNKGKHPEKKHHV